LGPGGHRYEVVSDPAATWSGADADARARGGFLVTIGDAAEQSFVEGLLSDAKAPSGSYWFGLRETGADGDYRQRNGSGLAPAYTHWLGDTRQPDNFAGRRQPDNSSGNENSASILWSNPGDPTTDRRGFWNDLPDSGGYPQVAAVYPDLVSRGYLVELRGVGSGFNNGDGDGRPSAVPLPAAIWVFPAGAVVAAAAARKLRRH
jgi:hypothetical protein